MSFYDNMAQTAARLITDKGRAVSILYKTNGQYDATSDKMAGSSLDPVDLYAAILTYRDSVVDGTMIKRGDKYALIAALGIEKPRVGDILNDKDVEYHIMDVSEIGPGDTQLIYKIQLRK